MLFQHVAVSSLGLSSAKELSTLRAVDTLVISHLLSRLPSDELSCPREFPDLYASPATDGPSNDASNRQDSSQPII